MLVNDFLSAIPPIIAAYLLGAIPSALLITRAFGLPDPRTHHSGNLGATNVARSGNKTAAVLTLLADTGKGSVAVLIAATLTANDAIVAAAAVAVVGGHTTSVFLRWKGGRGVATTMGTFLVWHPLIAAITLLAWITIFAICRYSSIASLLAVSAAALLTAITAPLIDIVAAAVIALIVWLKHRDNIMRLLRRKESRF